MVSAPLETRQTRLLASAYVAVAGTMRETDTWRDLVKSIVAAGMRPAVAVRPSTAIESVYPLVDEVDCPVEMVLVMTVEPGFGGQSFMPETLHKVKELRGRYPSLEIQVDGGVGPSTIDEAAAHGANVIVSGSAVFKAQDPKKVIAQLRDSVVHAQAIKATT